MECTYAEVGGLAEEGRFEEGLRRLPWAARRDAIVRLRRPEDRCLSLGAGLLLLEALESHDVEDTTLCVGSYGKPRLAHYPDLHFNLSHSGTVCVCAVSKEPVGVDVERMHDFERGVARISFLDEEQAWIADQLDQGRAFTRLWCRKESYLKLLGTGFHKDLKSFSVVPGAGFGMVGHFHEFEVAHHLICVCTSRKEEVTLRAVTPW